jgi:hypothetical protein
VIWEPGAARDLSEDDKKAWDARIDRADQVRKQFEPQWDRALKRYAEAIQPESKKVNPLLDFRHVESKKAQLFYQTPEVQLHPIDPQIPEIPGDAILPLRQRVLNHTLGPDGTDVKRTVHEALFDALAPSGFLPTEIGFDVRLAPARDALGAPIQGEDGQPVQVPVWGKPFWVRVSPKKLLIPDAFRSTKFDDAPWLGLKGVMPLTRAKREFALPEDFAASAQRDEAVFEHGDHPVSAGDPLVEFTKVWYRAELFDPTILNPDLYRLLVLVKGLDVPAKHIDSPFQAIDELGQLTPDSMRGNPIHLGTLRDLSDSAYIPSDLAVGAQLSKEVGNFRTDLLMNRRARQPLTIIDPMGFETGEIDKINAGEKVIFCKPGESKSGSPPVMVAQVGTEPRDNFAAQDYAERDWQGALGTNNNAAGQAEKKKTTATESRIVAGASSARAEAEKDRLREWFIAGVRKFDSVLQRTMTQRDLTLMLGPQGALLWEEWRALPGCYVYKILPDSGVHVDAQQFRAQKLDEYNLLRKDPLVNAPELLKAVMRALGHDPAKGVLPQQPESGPEPIKTSFAFKGEDLIGPQSQAVVEILAQMGITVSADAITSLKQAQLLVAAGVMGPDGKPPTPVGDSGAAHGGSANRTEPINQHSSERTGGVTGVGVM